MSTGLMTLPPAQYPALDPNDGRLALMRENLGGEGLSVADLTRIKVPTGGGTRWQIESATGTEVVDVVEGVILHTLRRRAYWSNPNPTQTPPDCSSADMETGVGTPGGACEKCPFNQFGSAPNKHGKACKEARLFFLLRPCRVLPDIIAAPPASLKAVRKYLLDLSQAGVPYCGVVTAFGLEKATNTDGVAFARITARMVGKLDEATYNAVLATVRQYESTFQAAAVQADDVAGPTKEV